MRRTKRLFLLVIILLLGFAFNVNADTCHEGLNVYSDNIVKPGDIIEIEEYMGDCAVYVNDKGKYQVDSTFYLDQNIFEIVEHKIVFTPSGQTEPSTEDELYNKCVGSTSTWSNSFFNNNNFIMASGFIGRQNQDLDECKDYLPGYKGTLKVKVKNVPNQVAGIYFFNHSDKGVKFTINSNYKNSNLSDIYIENKGSFNPLRINLYNGYGYKYSAGYTVSFYPPADTVNLVAFAQDENATVSGTGEISLHEGLNKHVVTVTNNGVSKSYVLYITNGNGALDDSRDTELSSLTTDNYKIVKTDYNEYKLEVPADLDYINLYAQSKANNVSIIGTGNNYLNGPEDTVLHVIVVDNECPYNSFVAYKINVVKTAPINSEESGEPAPTPTPIPTDPNGNVTDPINVYLFSGSGCPHCTALKEHLNNASNTYGKYYNVVEYEVWDNRDNQHIMDEVAKKMGEEVNGVPFLVIGNRTWTGYVPGEQDKDIDNAIMSEYNSSIRYDVMKTEKTSEEYDEDYKEDTKEDSKDNKSKDESDSFLENLKQINLYLFIGVGVLLLIAVVIFISYIFDGRKKD